jgi:hypothetical protein
MRERFSSEFDVAIVEQPGGKPDHAFLARGAGSRAIEVKVEPWGNAT